MFKEYTYQYHDPLREFSPFASISNRQVWDSIAPSLKKTLIKEGEKYLDFTYPALSATLYMNFYRTGNRTEFETIYFLRRNALNNLILAECVEHEGRFIDDIINGIFALCEESGWQLPAHNSYIRDTPSFPLPNSARPVLDLFACETGAQLAIIYYLLKDVLNEISPFIALRIEHELLNRIITPYLNEHFWWMGNGDEPMCNWTIWCTQNILITTFCTNQPAETKKDIFLKAAESIDYFLKEYGEDGCCDEGAQYYHHAALCLFNALEVLNGVTDNFFASFYELPKIKNMAAYINNVHVSGPYYINFADCSPKAGFAGAREFLFGKRTHNTALMSFAANHYQTVSDPLMGNEINLFYRLQSIFAYDEIFSFKPCETESKEELYYPSVGLFLTHDSHFFLAAKAGDNGDSHNHNDVGSFIIYKNGRPLFIDIGVESYTQKTFSSRRYEIWTMQSDYHNLPTLNGFMQKDGALFKATQISTYFNGESSGIEMELSTAYPENGHVTSYKRSLKLNKEHGITVKDDLIAPQGNTNVILNLITYEKPVVTDNLIAIGDLGSLTLGGSYSDIQIEQLPITDERLMSAWEHDIYRIRIYHTNSSFSLHIS